MNRTTSFHLDFLRLAAAGTVLLAHTSALIHPLGYLGAHGDEAVACFFVLSGFVIAYVATERETSADQYFIARAARIYPVVVIALLVTYVADHIGLSLAPENYVGRDFYNPDYVINGVVNLLFLNQMWLAHAVFGSNEPYWSLGFEIPFYLFFGFFMYFRGHVRVLLLCTYGVLIGPIVLSYLTLWGMGALLYRLMQRSEIRLSPAPAAIGVLMTVVFYVCMEHVLGWLPGLFMRSSHGLMQLFYFHSVGLLVALNIFFVSQLTSLRIPARVEQAVRWLAGGSFTLYLTHMPILLMVKSALPGLSTTIPGTCAIVISTLVACYLLAEVTERPKLFYRNLIKTALRSKASQQPAG